MIATLPLTAGTWSFDPNHSGVHFKVRHLGLTNVHGRFNGVDAWLNVGEDLAGTSFGATIDIATIDTNNADRDAHLLSTDFFSADVHPTMTFTSTAIRETGTDEFEADGDLTINGVTRPITLAVGSRSCDHPAAALHSGFIANTTILATTSASTSTCRSASSSSRSAEDRRRDPRKFTAPKA